MVWFSKEEFARMLPRYEELLTATPENGFEGNPDPLPIQQWVERRTRVGVPIAAGLIMADDYGITLEENLAAGTRLRCPKRPDPNHPSAPKGQGAFFEGLIDELCYNYTVLGEAPTGSGKTVAILNAVAEFERSAIIIVPSQRLLHQWREEALQHLGLEDAQIGLIGDGIEQIDRPLTICVLHNLLQKVYPPEFYTSFGLVAFDECHKLGAREFSRVMHQIPAVYKIAVSATPDRKDGCASVFTNYFGEVSVKSEQKPLPLYYELIPFKVGGIPRSLDYCRSTARPLLWLSEHEKRNAFIVDLIKEEYTLLNRDENQALLVLSKYQEHCEKLMELCSEGKGRLPEAELGLFTGKRPRMIKGVLKRTKAKKTELDEVAKSATVLFATYSMMAEGIDIPRISRGIEAMPVADVRQAVGRARRKWKSKVRAYWVSIQDTGIRSDNPLCCLYGFAAARIKGLRAVGGVTVKEETKR